MTLLQKSIIISGEICSGKSTVAKEISKLRSTPVASFGSYLLQYSNQHGMGTSRQNLQDLGDSFIRKDPKSFLMNVIEFSGNSNGEIIFEGVRHKVILHEISELSATTKLIYLDTSESIRFQRYNTRDTTNPISLEDFKNKCNHPVEQDIKLLKGKSDLMLDGSTDLDKLIQLIIQII